VLWVCAHKSSERFFACHQVVRFGWCSDARPLDRCARCLKAAVGGGCLVGGRGGDGVAVRHGRGVHDDALGLVSGSADRGDRGGA
jgi:hypothetical protein